MKNIVDDYDRLYQDSALIKQFNPIKIRMCASLIDGKKHVLDVGCGDGHLAKALLDLGHDVVCTDISSIRLDNTQKMLLPHGYTPALVRCDMEDESHMEVFGGSSFDAVYMLDVIEHLLSPPKALSNIRKLMVDDGVLVISTPNAMSLRRVLKYLVLRRDRVEREPPLSDLHLSHFDVPSLNQLLHFTGFRIERIIPNTILRPMRFGIGSLDGALARLCPLANTNIIITCRKNPYPDLDERIEAWRG